MAGITMAANPWTAHNNSAGSQQSPRFEDKKEEPAKVYIGHANITEQIWQYDGLSISMDTRAGIGVILTKDMFEPYAGGKITGMYVGYDDMETSAIYDCFVRKDTFNGETITSGQGEVYFGWNWVGLTEAEIPTDVDALCVGFYTDLTANLCQIPKLYPTGVENSCFLYHGEKNEDGEEMWFDSKELGKMTIVLEVTDVNGDFKNMISISNLRADVVNYVSEEAHTGIFQISNVGTNAVSSLEVTTTLGEESRSETVTFDTPIAQSATQKMRLPVFCLGSGKHNVSFTKVNDETPKQTAETEFSFIGVPTEVADEYTFRPLVQYIVSENSYMVPSYVNEIFMPTFEEYADRMTLVMPHAEDKFMTFDYKALDENNTNDDAINELIDLAGGDLMKVYIPQILFNRSDYIIYFTTIAGTPFHNGTPYPEVARMYYDDILAHPTFASVNINTTFDDDLKNLSIKVSGNVAENIMPEGEPLYLTVYVTETDITSQDQLFWDDKESGETAGEFTHPTVIRKIVTPYWGDKLDQTGGDYSKEYSVEVDSEWDLPSLKVIAFLNRGTENDNMNRQIINSEEVVAGESGIGSVNIDGNLRIEMNGGNILVGGEAASEVYNLSGVRVASSNLPAGIYIVKTEQGCRKVIVK